MLTARIARKVGGCRPDQEVSPTSADIFCLQRKVYLKIRNTTPPMAFRFKSRVAK